MVWAIASVIIYFILRRGKPKVSAEMTQDERKQHAKEDFKDMLMAAAGGFLVAVAYTTVLALIT